MDLNIETIKAKSPFKNLRSWNLVHMIIKTQDNLKQEQFALQLISILSNLEGGKTKNQAQTLWSVIFGWKILIFLTNKVNLNDFT